jgi:hypothetical protein
LIHQDQAIDLTIVTCWFDPANWPATPESGDPKPGRRGIVVAGDVHDE